MDKCFINGRILRVTLPEFSRVFEDNIIFRHQNSTKLSLFAALKKPDNIWPENLIFIPEIFDLILRLTESI